MDEYLGEWLREREENARRYSLLERELCRKLEELLECVLRGESDEGGEIAFVRGRAYKGGQGRNTFTHGGKSDGRDGASLDRAGGFSDSCLVHGGVRGVSAVSDAGEGASGVGESEGGGGAEDAGCSDGEHAGDGHQHGVESSCVRECGRIGEEAD